MDRWSNHGYRKNPQRAPKAFNCTLEQTSQRSAKVKLNRGMLKRTLLSLLDMGVLTLVDEGDRLNIVSNGTGRYFVGQWIEFTEGEVVGSITAEGAWTPGEIFAKG
jgi:hypothetical protein